MTVSGAPQKPRNTILDQGDYPTQLTGQADSSLCPFYNAIGLRSSLTGSLLHKIAGRFHVSFLTGFLAKSGVSVSTRRGMGGDYPMLEIFSPSRR